MVVPVGLYDREHSIRDFKIPEEMESLDSKRRHTDLEGEGGATKVYLFACMSVL